MWIHNPFRSLGLFASEKQTIVIVFVICITLKTVPELAAYPYPIGYDVINYYIPTVADFENRWQSNLSTQFSLYVVFLYLVKVATHLPAQSVVQGTAVVMVGIFGVSLFYLGRRLIELPIGQSAFVAIFAIFQVAILRTTWDLHKDIFALANMMFAFCILGREHTEWKSLAQLFALATLVVATDRMVGALFCMSLVAYAIMTRRRDVILTTILGVSLFCTLMVVSYGIPKTGVIALVTSTGDNTSQNAASQFYTPANLLILLAVINGLIAVPSSIGFFYMKKILLKIPLLISLVGSFSWLIFAEDSALAADRWIVLTGIFLSVFAGYGIMHILVKKSKSTLSSIAAGLIFTAFAAIGLAYSVMPSDNPFILYKAAGTHIQSFVPLTMQFNSLDIRDNKNLLSAIAWLNENTEHDAIIVGEKHWRGFMELHLAEGRRYLFSDDPYRFAVALRQQSNHIYLISAQGGSQTNFTIKDMSRR